MTERTPILDSSSSAEAGVPPPFYGTTNDAFPVTGEQSGTFPVPDETTDAPNTVTNEQSVIFPVPDGTTDAPNTVTNEQSVIFPVPDGTTDAPSTVTNEQSVIFPVPDGTTDAPNTVTNEQSVIFPVPDGTTDAPSTQTNEQPGLSCGCGERGTSGRIIYVGIITAVHISMIVMGALYFHDCPRQPYITIYLIVDGTFGLAKTLVQLRIRFNLLRRIQLSENNIIIGTVVEAVLNIFLCIWFITGSVWIYRIANDFDTVPNPEDPSHYCYEPLYSYAIWLISVNYAVIALLVFCKCIGCSTPDALMHA